MAFTSTTDHLHHRTSKQFRGIVTADDVTTCMQTTVRENAAAYAHLIDARTARSDLTGAQIQRLAAHLLEISQATPLGPIAIAADQLVTFGDFRMFAGWATDACPIRVFRTLEEAEDHLLCSRRSSPAH